MFWKTSTMEVQKVILIVFHLLIYTQTEGFLMLEKRNSWPIKDCRNQNIDLVFVADASMQNGMYANQMMLFSNLVDVFSPPDEIILNKLRVSLVVPLYNSTTSIIFVDTKVTFGSYNSNKTILKQAIDKCHSAVTTRSTIQDTARAVIQTVFNNTVYEPRQDALSVIIMFTAGMHVPDSFRQDLSKAYYTSRSMDVVIFFLIIGTEAASRVQASMKYTGHVLAEHMGSINQMHHIPISLCKTCFAGWFNAANRQSSSNASCYKLAVNGRLLNWIDANELCKTEMSGLASIETDTEHDRLRSALPYEINYIMPLSNLTSDSVSVYIGLRRRLSSIGQRFRWENQKPLTYSQWQVTQPQGGSSVGCVRWKFPIKTLVLASLIRDSVNDTFNHVDYPGDLSDGWASVGCGSAEASLYLCEVKNNWEDQQSESVQLSLNKPSDQSILAAVKRGELGFHLDSEEPMMMTLVSTLAIYRDGHSHSFAYVNHDMERHIHIDSLNMFFCDNFTQIPFSMVCDHVINCTNEADEMMCGYSYRTCNTLLEFTCNNKQCIPIAAKCDLYNDCLDGSDEVDCITCSHDRCQNARCLPRHWFLDGEIDCNSCQFDGSLEDEASSLVDSEMDQCVFICNRTECVYVSMLNDSIVQCQGPEGELDETLGALESTTCYSDSDNLTTGYTNWAPRCIYIRDRYGEPLGCRNMRHLEKCSNFVCPDGYFKCPNSYCIPTHYVKNSEYDCTNGEDEDSVALKCPGYYRCAYSSVCLHPDYVCNRQVNCPRGDDEINCHVTCREGFLCLAGTVTVDGYNKAVPLTDLDFVAPSTRYLHLSGINVSAVFPGFPSGRLTNVLNLSLSGCSITNVDSRFTNNHNDIRGMWWVDLSYNLIQRVPHWNLFKSMYALQFLNLSHNELLTYVPSEAFSPFRIFSSVLKVLDLSYTGLCSLESSLLNLNRLEKLLLRNTRIVEIPYNMFPRHITLHVLDLRGLTLNDLYPDMFKNVTITTYLFTDSFKLCCPQLHNDNTDVKVCVSAKDPFSSCSDLMSQMILRILLWVSGVLAIVGNAAVIVYRLSFDKTIFKMAYGHFIMHLSFADLFMGIYLLVIATADTYYRDSYVWDEFDWRNSAACEVAGFLSTLSSETSTFFIFLITIDRFFAMRFPFRKLKFSGKFITLTCVVTWVAGFSVASIPLLPQFNHWNLYSTNGMCLALPLRNRWQPGWQFSTSIFIFFNFFLFILIAFGQLAIYRSVFAMRMSQSKLSNASSRRAQDLAIAKNLFLVVFTDFLCWFPIGVMGLLVLSGHEIGSEAYAWSAVLVLPVNSAINPVLYTVPAVTRKLRQYKDGVTSQRSKSQ